MLNKLDPIFSNELRLVILTILVKEQTVDFKKISELTQATAGNISAQLSKLEEVGYVKISKAFLKKYPSTTILLTNKGLEAFSNHVRTLQNYLKGKY